MGATNKKRNVSSDIEGKEEKLGITTENEAPKASVSKGKSVKGLADLSFSDEDKKKILVQVQSEYEFATKGLTSWIDKNLNRLRLYNNQKRQEDLVGEPLLFTHMNTWLASLYDDELDKAWTPRDDGDIEAAENLTNVAEYDTELMDKAELDLNVLWDALFFSYGLIDHIEFDVDRKCPAPSAIDPTSFLYDSLSASIDGNSVNKGGMRFLGWSMYMNEREVDMSPIMEAGALKKLRKEGGKESDKQKEARQLRIEALGGDIAHFDKENMGNNNVYEVLQWRTWWDGKKVILLLTPEAKDLLGGKILPVDEDTGDSISWWVSAKRINPQPHQFKGVSLPDILEDKQRKKAVLINDALNLTRISVYGSHGYNKNLIKNTNDLKWGYDKWIAVDGDPRTAIAPIYKDSPNLNVLDNMLNYLDVSAQTASATPSLQQGVLSEQQRTLGELQMVSESSKTRYSLALKTISMGDKDFWNLWYLSYKVFFNDGLGDKVIRISGSTRSFRKISRKDILCKVDPDVRITSKALAEAKKQREFIQYMKVMEYVMQDTDADKRAGEKHGLYLAGMDKEVIDTVLPPTSDEVIAREQNDMLDEGKVPPFLPNDNHRVHIRIHKEAMDSEKKTNHINLHVKALKMVQANPNLAPQEQAGMSEGQTAPQGAVSTSIPMGESNLSGMM